MSLHSINPYTELEIASFEEDSSRLVEQKLEAAAAAFQSWRHSSFAERRSLMLQMAQHIRNNRDRMAVVLTQEMGKPILQSRGEVDRFADRCDYFATSSEELLAPERVELAGAQSWIRYEPLGVALGVMPWNFPFGQASRWAIPAVMAGNTALLKHASNVTLSALLMEEAFKAVGFPPGVFSCLLLSHESLEPILSDRRIAAVSLTGSVAAGESIGAIAGRGLKKLVLELGGSDPFIVLSDANVEAAAKVAVRGRFLNNSGQACTASKRFIVCADVAAHFTECFIEATRKLLLGDPMADSTQVGPLAKQSAVGDLERCRDATVAAGARVAYTADAPTGTGFFFPPTVLVGVRPDMPAATEETFGPLAAIIEVTTEQEAIRVANESDFGLGASLWTGDTEKGAALVAEIDAGMVAVNSLLLGDSRLPFGGVKKSGFGRELSAHGLRELTNIKSVNIRL
jgi:succinate-semialdehyde dehydrogenase/glutarate-semialdehyde dehydrogenase